MDKITNLNITKREIETATEKGKGKSQGEMRRMINEKTKKKQMNEYESTKRVSNEMQEREKR